MNKTYLHFNGCHAKWELYQGSHQVAQCGSREFLRDGSGRVRQWDSPLDAIGFARSSDPYAVIEVAV